MGRTLELRVHAARMLVFALAYALAVVLGRSTRIEGTELALVWPAAAVGALWVLSSGSMPARAVAAAGVLVVGTVVTDLTGAGTTFAVAYGAVNVVISVVTAELLLRADADPSLRVPGDVGRMLVAVGVGNAVGALLAALVFETRSDGDFVTMASLLFVRNSVSTAFGLACWLTLRRASWTRPDRFRMVEGLVTGVATVAVFWLIFWAYSGVPLKYVAVPISAWIAVRFSTVTGMLYALGAGTYIVVISLFRGGFLDGSELARAMTVQALVGVILVVVLLLAVYRDSQQRLIASLDDTSAELRDKAGLLEAVLDGISDGVVVVDGRGRHSLTNAAASGSGLVTQFVTDSGARSDHPGRELLRRARRGDRVEPTILNVHHDLADRVLSVSARPLPRRESSGAAVAVFRDVTDERHAQERLREARDLFAGVLDAASEQSIIGVDAEGWVTVFNVGAERMLGYRRSEMLGRSPLELHPADELHTRALELGLAPGFEVLVHQARVGRTETREWTYVRKDGSRLDVNLSVSAMRGGDDEVIGFILVGTDITHRRRAERSLAESEERFRLAFDTAPVGMCIVRVDDRQLGRISRVNLAMTRFVGRTEDQLVGRRVQALEAVESEGTVDVLLERLSRRPEEKQAAEVAFRHLDGSVVWGSLSSAVVQPPGGGAPYGICLIEDVTARKDIEAELRHLALHDALTGLPNRVLFADRLQHALAGAERSGLPVGMVVLDLDGFKEVNDRWGHAEGDELLRAVATRLGSTIRPGDTLARLGGDEFAVVCPEIGQQHDLEMMAARLAAELRKPYMLGSGHTHAEVTASVGIALSAEHGTAEDLLQSGDQAMYDAKRHGKDRIEHFDRLGDEVAARRARLSPELRRGLDRDEFVMFGQPIRDVDSGEAVAVETLVRWQHPERGLLTPADFLDAVEGTSDMTLLGRHVLRESCRMAARWQRPDRLVRVHVNVSGRQLGSGVLRAEVEEALEESGLVPEALVIELTETHASIVPSSVIRDLGRLRSTGVRVAIDDIGTGYSSLARLTELPVDLLKIDRQFVSGIGDDSRCEAVVRGVLGIGEALDLEVVAEGIEQPHELQRLRDWGCRLMQGYLLGHPLPEREIDLQAGRAGTDSLFLPRQQSRHGTGC